MNELQFFAILTVLFLFYYNRKEDKQAFEEFEYMKSYPTIEANLEGLELCRIAKNILS